MRFDNTNKAQAIDAFNQLPAPVRSQMQLSSVRLTNGAFTGSGVLVNDSNNNRGIVTAKHNLAVRQGIPTPLDWDQAEVEGLVAGFLDGLRVGYGPLSLPLAPQNLPVPTRTQNLTPENSAIEFRDGDGSWDYDLMFIALAGDIELSAYIGASPAHRITYNYDDRNFYKANPVGRAVFVTGFGDIENHQGEQTTLTHAFQARTAIVTERLATVQRLPDANFTDVLIVGASNNTSTAPGDSGGPMLHAGAHDRVYLLGATLGSNFEQDAMPDDEPIINNASTYLYRQGVLF